MLKLLSSGLKSIAAGRAGASLGIQSPHLPNAITRVGRFFYSVSAVWIGGIWYIAYANMRTPTGEGPTLVLPGKKVINTPDRGNKVPPFATSVTQLNSTSAPSSNQFVTTPNIAGRTLVALGPTQLGVPGTALPGFLWSAPNSQKQLPPFNRSAYNALTNVASKIAQQFGLHITSGYRPGSQGLHSSGLAFDMVGPLPQMKKAATWASQNPSMFQEIFIHNEGSGLHLHLGFYPDAVKIFTSSSNSMVRTTQTPQKVRG